MQNLSGTLGMLTATRSFEQRMISFTRTVVVLNTQLLEGKSQSRGIC